MEESVIQKAVKGDIQAYKKIFDFYMPRMRPLCLRYVRTDFEADDILQESFIKIFKNLKQFQFKGSFEGWIKRIVINTALTYYKKNFTLFVIDNVEEIDESDIEQDTVGEIEDTDTSDLLKIIDELPPGYKLVFNLYVMEDYSHKEIADMLGISEGSSRSQYSKAKKMIIKLLSRQRNEDKSSLLRKMQ
ncbi:MAG: RNA polymerase sigma factor [Cytophagaceae bacterium]